MPAPKGNKFNTKGRPGAKNRATVEAIKFREKFRDYCIESEGFRRFIEELTQLKGKAYVEFFLKALEFAEPKLARQVDQDGNDVKQQNITVTITDERGTNTDSV